MIDHLELQTRQLDAVASFYQRVLAPLGYTCKVDGKAKGFGAATDLDLFILEGEPSAHVHYAFRASSRALVRACFDKGRDSNGTLEREPALAPSVHPNYFAAYLRDPDGRLVEFVCHAEE